MAGDERRAWSVITAEQMRVYGADAEKLIVLAEQHRISPFAAALAGVALIRNAVALMGGTPEWWVALIMSTKENPLEDFTID